MYQFSGCMQKFDLEQKLSIENLVRHMYFAYQNFSEEPMARAGTTSGLDDFRYLVMRKIWADLPLSNMADS